MEGDTLQKIALSMAKGINGSTLMQLIDRIGDIHNFFSLSRAELSRMAGISSEIFAEDYRQTLLGNAMREEQFVRSAHADALFIADDEYPRRLANCDDAPALLYKLGSCNLDSAHMVGIVGTRHSTAYGIDFTTRLVNDLAKKLDSLVVVSGLAYGIDVAAHKAALSAGVPTAAVVAHGLNMIYPAEHRQIAARMIGSGGALVTEYRSDSRVHRSNFLARNRIVAGLCDCVVVVESDIHGGAMSTARIALQYGREVLAVPGRVSDTYSRGTNRLIANNTASLITCADDLMELMKWTSMKPEEKESPALFTPLTPEQQRIVDFIEANREATVNEMCVHLGISYSQATDLLFQLEMNDVVRAIPGGRYEKI